MFMYEGISYDGEKCTAVSVEDGRHCRNRFYFIRHLLIHQIFWLNDSHLLKRPLGASSTVKSHKSQQSNATL